MTRYVYQDLFDSIRDWMDHGLADHGHTLDQAISYTIVELGMMPRPGDDPIWTTLNFTALFVTAIDRRIEGEPEREINQFSCDWASGHTASEAVVVAALAKDEDRQAFLTDLARVRANLRIQW